ncbi:hypothetical protein NDU88_001931 [Pleurodeles waltl]|uniref:Uncharacterized protein n=1 Tax=Pleurodeles waltl TaxID=8319 RepID=A0AAV7ML67_PLEWA|nr:hypothetical protein NDU88_001931 [Pleurodeles waltl]
MGADDFAEILVQEFHANLDLSDLILDCCLGRVDSLHDRGAVTSGLVGTCGPSGAPWSCGGARRGAEPDQATGRARGARGRRWLPGWASGPCKAERGADNRIQVQLRRWQGAVRRVELGCIHRAAEVTGRGRVGGT